MSPTIHVLHAVWGYLGAVTPSACLSHALYPPEGNLPAQPRRQQPAPAPNRPCLPLAAPRSSSDLQHEPSGEHPDTRASSGLPSALYRDALKSISPTCPGEESWPHGAQPPQSPPDGWETCPAPKGTPGPAALCTLRNPGSSAKLQPWGKLQGGVHPSGMRKDAAPWQRDCKRN